MATDLGAHFLLLDDLDARQNDVLDQLEALDQRLAALLREYSAPSGPDVAARSVAPVQMTGLADGP